MAAETLGFSPKFIERVPEGLELRNEATQSLDIPGSEILHHQNPGLTIVRYPYEGTNVAVAWFNDPVKNNGLITPEGIAQFGILEKIVGGKTFAGRILTDNNPDKKASNYGIDIDNVFKQDFTEFSRGNRVPMEKTVGVGHGPIEKSLISSKPEAATVRGLIVGGGFEFTIPSHFIVQGPNAAYGLPECALDVPKFIRDKYDPNFTLPRTDYPSGHVLNPGWLGHIVLLNKLLQKGKITEELAIQIVDDFTFNSTFMEAKQAQEIGLADVTVPNKTLIMAAAFLITQRPFSPRSNSLLRLPDRPNTNPAPLDTPGKLAGAALLYDHPGFNEKPYGELAQQAIELISSAMHFGLGVDGPAPYPQHSHLFDALSR